MPKIPGKQNILPVQYSTCHMKRVKSIARRKGPGTDILGCEIARIISYRIDLERFK
jgi:hypothetical protein